MAVEHNMAELNTTWWDLLQKIVFSLDWSYAALWTLTPDGRHLVWQDGYFYMRSNDDANANLFHSLYSLCTFTPGDGFAGHALAHMTNSILWLSGDELNSLKRPVANQTRFLKAAGIQTVVCLPLGLPSSSYVLELGTVKKVRESEAAAQGIKKTLLHLLADGLQLINENAASEISQDAQQTASNLLGVRMRAPYYDNSPLPQSSVATTSETPPAVRKLARTTAAAFYPSSFEGGALSKPQQQLGGNNILPESLQSIGHDDIFARQIAEGILNAVRPQQLSVEVLDLPGPAEPSPVDRLSSPWATESSLSQMKMNAFQSWTSMAEATSALDVGLREVPLRSSAPSSHLAQEIVDPNNGLGQILSFPGTLDQVMAAASDDQPQQHALPGGLGGASLGRSSSRSSVSLRSQNMEDNEISSAILESYADCHISELDQIPRHVCGVTEGGSSSTTMPGESGSNWRNGAQRGSEPSSKVTSPDNNAPPHTRQSFGIHPRLSTTSSSQKQQQRAVDLQAAARLSQAPRARKIERQHSSIPEQNPQEEDLKPAAGGSDSTPRLVQFGNVLQLGNAADQVTEPLPQDHDEAAVSHMLAERRRRIKQNEKFDQLKFLVPTAGKTDKASLLAATIAHIHELKERVKDLEQSSQSLRNQLCAAEQDVASTVQPLMSTKAKGSPGRLRARTPNSLSPTDEDKIQVSPSGDGNLTIEIRKPCTQPDTVLHIFACLKEMQLKVINFSVAVNDNRIHASIIVKMKRKNSAGQSAVCAEMEQALRACLNSLG